MYMFGIMKERISAMQIGIAKSTSAIFTQVRYADKPTAIVPVD